MALMFGDKQVKCGDQNNPDLYKKPMLGKALCLPETIGSTTGGMVLYTACAMGKQPACMLFSKPIDSLAASGAILAASGQRPKCRWWIAWEKNSCLCPRRHDPIRGRGRHGYNRLRKGGIVDETSVSATVYPLEDRQGGDQKPHCHVFHGGTSIFGWMEPNHFDREAANFLLERAKNNVGLLLPGIAPIRDPMGGRWLYQNPAKFKASKLYGGIP